MVFAHLFTRFKQAVGTRGILIRKGMPTEQGNAHQEK